MTVKLTKSKAAAQVSQAQADAAQAKAVTEATKAEMSRQETANAQADAAVSEHKAQVAKDVNDADANIDATPVADLRNELYHSNWEKPASGDPSSVPGNPAEGADGSKNR